MNRKKSLFLCKYVGRWMINMVLIILLVLPLTSFMPLVHPFGIRKVCIDAGHGGHDPGCIGSSSREKDIALAISLKLGAYIEKNMPGVEVIYTRTTDKFVELHERAKIANNNDADLFICIHCNSSANANAIGAETYVMGLHKTKDNLAVAKRENASVLMESDYKQNYDGFDPNSEEGNIIFTLYQSAFLEQSLNFASKVQDQFRESVKRNDRGVKQAGFLVLYRTTMPSVLIETGFLSNKDDEAFLKDIKGQDDMARAIYEAFRKYRNEFDQKLGGSSESGDAGTGAQNNNAGGSVSDNASANAGGKVIFRVQLATSSTPVDLVPSNFKGIENVKQYEADGIYRYTYGEEYTLEAASRVQEEVRSKGYTDAFVVAFLNGKRITVSEALKELNK